MTIRWSATGLRDLESAHAYVAENNPDAAADYVDRIVTLIEGLQSHPELGRKGRVAGTRELIIPPFVVAYRLGKDAVEILGMIHSARRWLEAF